MKNNQKGSAYLIALILIVLLIIASLAFYKIVKTDLSTDTKPTGATEIEVTGMKQYIDTDFGFSFWYPETWKVVSDLTSLSETNLQGGNVVKKLRVENETGDYVAIQEFDSLTSLITDSGGAGPFGPVTYFFDPTTNSWIVGLNEEARMGTKPATTTITTFTNTMGGLHMFSGTSRFNTVIIPLRPNRFVVINNGGGINSQDLSNTVTALDPSVATPLSVEEQIKIIRAEADSYSVDNLK